MNGIYPTYRVKVYDKWNKCDTFYYHADQRDIDVIVQHAVERVQASPHLRDRASRVTITKIVDERQIQLNHPIPEHFVSKKKARKTS